jgi:nucleotide-binding universal stress UspA family protein
MKVLVPVDGSVQSLEALKVAIDYVKIKGADMNVISVIPSIGGSMEDHEISPARIERHVEGMERRANDIVKHACDILASEKVMSSCAKAISTSASIPDAIIDFAEDENIDLIIMGSRGLSASTRIKLGSVATQVIKYSPCSVYLVKTPMQD